MELYVVSTSAPLGAVATTGLPNPSRTTVDVWSGLGVAVTVLVKVSGNNDPLLERVMLAATTPAAVLVTALVGRSIES